MKSVAYDSVGRVDVQSRTKIGDRQPVSSDNRRNPTLAGRDRWPGDRDLAEYRIAAARARSDLIRQVWGSAVQRLRSWRERQRAIAALERLGDRALADFGISRGDIHRLRSGDWSVAEFNAEREALRSRWLSSNGKHNAGFEVERIQPRITANLPAYDHAA